MNLNDKLMKALFGLDAGANERVATQSYLEGNPEKLSRDFEIAMNLIDALTNPAPRNEEYELPDGTIIPAGDMMYGALPSGPPGWLKGVITGGVGEGGLLRAPTRKLLDALRDESRIYGGIGDIRPQKGTYEAGLGKNLEEKTHELYERLRGKLRYKGELESEWKSIYDDLVGMERESLAPMSTEAREAHNKSISSVIQDLKKRQNTLGIMDESLGMRERNILEAATGNEIGSFPSDLDPAALSQRIEQVYNAVPGNANSETFTKFMNRVLPRLSKEQHQEFVRDISRAGLSGDELAEYIRLTFGDLLD